MERPQGSRAVALLVGLVVSAQVASSLTSPLEAQSAALPTTQPLRIEVGAGLDLPIHPNFRELYGLPASFSLGLAGEVLPARWLTLEFGVSRLEGDIFPDDPTFDAFERVWLIPLSIGIRGTMQPERQLHSPFRLHAGASLVSVLVTVEEALNSQSRTDAAFGVAFELRPEYRLNQNFSLWLTQRFQVLSELRRSAKDVSLTKVTLLAGLAWSPRR